MDDIVKVHRSVICGEDMQTTYLFPTLRIVRVLSGGAHWQIGGEVYWCSAGDIILLNNTCARRITDCRGDEPFVLEVFSILPVFLTGERQYTDLFYRRGNPVYRGKGAKKAETILDILSGELQREAHDQQLVRHLLESVCLLLKQSEDTLLFEEYKYPSASQAVFETAAYIWENIEKPLSVGMLSAHVSLSRTYLQKQFKEVYGMGISAFIRRCRIYHVVNRLEAEKGGNILNIALEAGFTSSSGFYKAFSAVTGMSPTAYLKKRRKGKSVSM